LSVSKKALNTIFNNSQHPVSSHVAFLKRNANAFNDLGESLFERGYIEAAHNSFFKAISLDSNSPVINNNIGVLHWYYGTKSISLQYVIKALELDCNNSKIIENAINIFKYYGYYDQAKEICIAYLKKNPDNKRIMINLNTLNREK